MTALGSRVGSVRPVWNPSLYVGEVLRVPLRLRGPNRTPVDLTGAVLTLRGGGGYLTASLSNPAQGEASLEARGERPGRWVYQLLVEWPDGQKWTLLMGVLTVREVGTGA